MIRAVIPVSPPCGVGPEVQAKLALGLEVSPQARGVGPVGYSVSSGMRGPSPPLRGWSGR